MTAILKHELRSYFNSFTAWVFGAFLLIFIGFGAMVYNLENAVANFEYVFSYGCIQLQRRGSDYLCYRLCDQ